MNILFLRGFNNYFNRVVKKYSTLDEYRTESSSYIDLANINFNPNDGVATELIVGNENQKENNAPLDWENIGTPDYCICYENSTSGTPPVTTSTIISRWFVLESERTRTGQYRLALKRDVVAEHFDQIKVAPCFIEKGMVNDIENPLLYNKESMTYNQIKVNEIPLKDNTNSGWIVGYVPKNRPADPTGSDISGSAKIMGEPDEYLTPEDLPFTLNNDLNTITNVYVGVKNDLIGQAPITYEDGFHWSIWTGGYTNYRQALLTYYFSSYMPVGGGYDPRHIQVEGNPGVRGPSVGSPNNDNGVLEYNVSSEMTGRLYTLNNDDKILYGNNHSKYSWWANGWSHGPGDYGDANITIPDFLLNYRKLDFSLTTTERTYVSVVLAALNTASPNNSLYKNYKHTDSDSILAPYKNKYIKIGTNFYKINITYAGPHYTILKHADNNISFVGDANSTSNVATMTASGINNFFNIFQTEINNQMTVYDSTYSDNRYYTSAHNYDDVKYDATGFFYRRYSRYDVSLTIVNDMTVTMPYLSSVNRMHTYDCVDDLFAIPYGDIAFKLTSDGDTYHTDKYTGLAMARYLAASFSTHCHDLQVVPYCPSEIIRNYLEANDGLLELYNIDSTAYQSFTKTIDNVTTTCGFCLWCSSCRGTVDIPITNVSIPIYTGVDSDALRYKLCNETRLYRLVSPNFNGIYEFSIAKNKGLTSFNADYYYQPGMPYIHINPGFNENGLYGKDWNDIRGVICGGNFSMAIQIDQWLDYVANNKNYQQIFDRQIQNMDVNNAIAMEKQQFQATVGAITGTIGGGIGGAMTGAAAGPWGALAGAIIGTAGGAIAGGIGAKKDIEWLERQQQEARSFAIDMYGYQLGNIQAMPYSIRGSDSLTENNKIWPILEIFECKPEEIEILKNKIEYNGMTVMAVGNIQDYCSSEDFNKVFIKGQIIRLESNGINDDFHIADAIYQEINKGVYIPSGGL